MRLAHHTNLDGIRQTGEAGLAGEKVYVDANNNGQLDRGEAWTTTRADGVPKVRGEFEYGSRAVVVASGGIGGNHDLVRQNWPKRLGEHVAHRVAYQWDRAGGEQRILDVELTTAHELSDEEFGRILGRIDDAVQAQMLRRPAHRTAPLALDVHQTDPVRLQPAQDLLRLLGGGGRRQGGPGRDRQRLPEAQQEDHAEEHEEAVGNQQQQAAHAEADGEHRREAHAG